jgi:hypothetical protein
VEWRTLIHPNGIPEVITPPPFEAAGAFLTIEAGSTPAAGHLMGHLTDVIEGRRDRLGMTFNVFSLEAGPAEVVVAEDPDLAPGEPRSCRVPTTEFRGLLAEWEAFLTARVVAGGG